MAIAFVQGLLSGNSCVAGTGLTFSGSKTLTAGNDIILVTVSDTPGGVDSVTDNLGNTYDIVYVSELLVGSPPLIHILRATNVAGGTLTSQVVTFGTSTTCRAGLSCEYSGVADSVSVGGETNVDNVGSTAPEGHSVAGDSLHLFVVAQVGPSDAASTPPTGYQSRASEFASPGGGGDGRGIWLSDRIGVDDNGLKVATLSASRDWVTATSNVLTPVFRPALAGISFDGVTVR